MGIDEGERIKKRYGLLLAARESEYVKKVHGGYLNVFVEAFGDEEEGGGERWDVFRVVDGEFPHMDDLQHYDAFVVSGSPFDAYGDDPWILHLSSLLLTLYSMHKKLLGICFGHQILCRALGGKVGKSEKGWDIGLTKVTFLHHQFFPSLPPPPLSIIQCHQDKVLEVPMGAKVIAFSEKTGVEMFTIGDQILGIQGHPEYTTDILLHLIDRLLSQHSIDKEMAEDARLKMENEEPDRMFWQGICKDFLKEIPYHSDN